MSNTRYVRILPSAVESKYSGNILKSGDIHKVDWQYTDGCFVIFSHDQRFVTIHIEPQHVKEVYVYDEPRVVPAAEAQHTDKPMRVRVVKCNNPSYWYALYIGYTFDVTTDNKDTYIVKRDVKGPAAICKDDCEVVKPEPDRIAELEKRVAKLEEQQSRTTEQLTQFSISLLKLNNAVSPIGSPLDVHKTEEKPIYQGGDGKGVTVTLGTSEYVQHDHIAKQSETNLDRAKRLYYKGVSFKCLLDDEECVSTGKFEEDSHGNIWALNADGFVLFGGQWAKVVQPAAEVNQWRLKVDVPEWGLKKGDMSDLVRDSGEARFMPLGWIPASIMPYIADPVGGVSPNSYNYLK